MSAFENRFQAVADSVMNEISWKQFFAIICISMCKDKPTVKELAEIIGETIIGRTRTIRIYLHDIEARVRDAQLLLWTEKGVFEIEEVLDSEEETWILRTISKADVLQFIDEKKEGLLGKEVMV